jgi:hypothetical protein
LSSLRQGDYTYYHSYNGDANYRFNGFSGTFRMKCWPCADHY